MQKTVEDINVQNMWACSMNDGTNEYVTEVTEFLPLNALRLDCSLCVCGLPLRHSSNKDVNTVATNGLLFGEVGTNARSRDLPAPAPS
jgi:hypothetical protein